MMIKKRGSLTGFFVDTNVFWNAWAPWKIGRQCIF